MKRQIAIALGLSFVAVNTSLGHMEEPINPLDQSEFRAIELPSATNTPPPSIIVDSMTLDVPSARPETNTPNAKVSVDIKAAAGSKITSSGPVASGRRVSGLASYYCSPQAPVCANGYPVGTFAAAAGPKLRIAMGGGASVNASQPWRNKTVHVCGSNGCAKVKLIDWCQCYYKQSNEKVIDLYKIVFDVVGASKGRVTISW